MAIPAIAAAAAVASAGYGIAAGEEAKSDRKNAMRRQDQLQKKAEAQAITERQRAAEATAKVSQETVDPLALLSFEQTLKPPSLGQQIPRSSLKTSGPTLLGDA